MNIEGQSRAGSIQASQSGPDDLLEVTLHNVAVPSEYWVTVTWENGEKLYRSFTSTPQRDTVHTI